MSASEEFFGLKVPFLRHLGVRAELGEAGRSRLSLELRPELMNSFDVSHGGVIMTLLDVAMGIAARSAHQHTAGVMTIDMSVTFLAAGKGTLIAEGRVLRSGRSLNFCEAELRDSGGTLVAKSLGTFKLRREMHPGEGN